MRANVLILYVIWFFGVPAYTVLIRKNCSDCVVYKSCTGAAVADELRLYTQIRRAECGLDSAGLRRVCCAELTSATEVALTHTVSYHTNLLLLPDNCGVGEDDSYGYRIAGGVPVLGFYEYPWMVFISYKTKEGIKFQCGGSLINARYVLTAAHCVSGHEVYAVKIRVYDVDMNCQGESSIGCESNVQDIFVEEAIPHPGYQRLPVIRNDIGLLRLKNPVNLLFNDAGTICLPVTRSMRARDIAGLTATVVHREHTEKSYESATLLYINVSIYTAQYCQEQYNRNRKHGEEDEMMNKICSDSSSKGACRGYSGAPLMVWDRFGDRSRFIQYGVVSYGPNRCGTEYPEVYTDVTKYMVWILNTMKP